MAKLIADFTNVEQGSGGGGARVPEGDYRVRIDDVKVGIAKSSGNTMLIWTYEITEGKHKGKKLSKDYTTLNPEALWKLDRLFQAMGRTLPRKKIDLTPIVKKLRGKELGVTVTDEEYTKDGSEKTYVSSKVSEYIGLEDLGVNGEEEEDEEDEEEEAKPKAKKKKGKKKKQEEEEEDEDEIEDLDLDDI
jgi:hypothetical protein